MNIVSHFARCRGRGSRGRHIDKLCPPAAVNGSRFAARYHLFTTHIIQKVIDFNSYSIAVSRGVRAIEKVRLFVIQSVSLKLDNRIGYFFFAKHTRSSGELNREIGL